MAILYGVRSKENPKLWRSYGESFTRGVPFQDAQFWRNPKTAAKEAAYQEARRKQSEEWVARGVHDSLSYMGPCEVVSIEIPEPAHAR